MEDDIVLKETWIVVPHKKCDTLKLIHEGILVLGNAS